MKMIEIYAKKELFNLIMHATDTFSAAFATLRSAVIVLCCSSGTLSKDSKCSTSEDGEKHSQSASTKWKVKN